MEKQVTAERELRAVVARSEGEKQSRINMSEGQKLEMINRSEGQSSARSTRRKAAPRRCVQSPRQPLNRSKSRRGHKSERWRGLGRLQLAEKYLRRLRVLARPQTRVVLPTDLSDLEGVLKNLDIDWLGKNARASR